MWQLQVPNFHHVPVAKYSFTWLIELKQCELEEIS